MTGLRTVLAVALALAIGAPAALGGMPTPETKPPSHSLRGMLGHSSFNLKQRTLIQNLFWYIPNRLYDVVDILGLEVGGGAGVHGNVHLTRKLQLGLGRAKSLRVGLMSRYPGMVDERIREQALLWRWELDLKREKVMGGTDTIDISETDLKKQYYKEVDTAGVGVSLFAGVVGVGVELKGHELLDLVLGILTLDPLHDDQ